MRFSVESYVVLLVKPEKKQLRKKSTSGINVLLFHIFLGCNSAIPLGLQSIGETWIGSCNTVCLVVVDAIPTAVQCAHDGFVCMCVFCVVARRGAMFLYNAK